MLIQIYLELENNMNRLSIDSALLENLGSAFSQDNNDMDDTYQKRFLSFCKSLIEEKIQENMKKSNIGSD